MDAVSKVRVTAIYEYDKFISKLEKGYKLDYTNILNMINYMEVYPYINETEFIPPTFYNLDINYGCQLDLEDFNKPCNSNIFASAFPLILS